MGSRPRSAPATWLRLTLVTTALLGTLEASAAQLTASWVDNSGGVATTRIERRLGTDPVFTEIADALPGRTAYVDQTVSVGKSYCYRVFAWVVDGVSPYSDEVCATSSETVTVSQTVTVSKTGNGVGTVASSPAGINCGTDCSETYLAGTSVTLGATPAAGSIFTGWSGGGCAGTAPCTFAGNTSVIVTASFSAAPSTPTAYTVNVAKTGNGAVTSFPSGINCGADCSGTYSTGTTVTLTATPGNNHTFVGWRGGCAGVTSRTCTVSASTSTSAHFRNVK